MVNQFIRYRYMGKTLIDWNIEEFCGYKPISTYYTDFGMAEWYGKDAVRETFDNAMKNWGDDIQYITEIVMVLNWKIFEHYHSGNEELAEFYDGLWREAMQYVLDHFKEDREALNYYYSTTD